MAATWAGVAQVVPRYCLFLCQLASRRMVIKTAMQGWATYGRPMGSRWVAEIGCPYRVKMGARKRLGVAAQWGSKLWTAT